MNSKVRSEEIDERINRMTSEEKDLFYLDMFDQINYYSDSVDPDDKAVFYRIEELSIQQENAERAKRSVASGYDYRFDFCIYTDNEPEINGLTLNDAMDMLTEHIASKTSSICLGVNYSRLDGTGNYHKGLGSLELAKFKDNEINVTDETELDEIKGETIIRINALEQLKSYKFDFDRANKPFESITSMFKRVDGESFDSCDFDFDTTVTIDSVDSVTDSYDRFCKAVYDNVNVIRDEDEKHILCCDWSEFIYRYYDKLKDFSNKYWIKNNYDDPDDFVCEWIAETNRLLAGYGYDRDYKALSDLIDSKPNLENEQYKEFMSKSIYPYLSQITKSEHIDVKGNTQTEVRTMADNIAVKDYEKGKAFPDTPNFKGLRNYHIISEINDAVVGIRNTDYTYATWNGNSVTGVSGGHYMMNRTEAFEDFAIRAGLIDGDRYMTEKQVEEYHSLLSDKEDSYDNIDTLENGSNVIKELMNDSRTFTVIQFDNGDIIVSSDYISDLYDDNDELTDYLKENRESFDDYVDANISHYIIGNGNTDSCSVNDEQLAFIRSNLDEVINKADLLESNDCSARFQDLIDERGQGC